MDLPAARLPHKGENLLNALYKSAVYTIIVCPYIVSFAYNTKYFFTEFYKLQLVLKLILIIKIEIDYDTGVTKLFRISFFLLLYTYLFDTQEKEKESYLG